MLCHAQTGDNSGSAREPLTEAAGKVVQGMLHDRSYGARAVYFGPALLVRQHAQTLVEEIGIKK